MVKLSIMPVALAMAAAALAVPAPGLAQENVARASLTQFGVSPLRMEVDADARSTQMRVRNRAGSSLRVQLRAFEWRQVDGKDSYERAQDVRISPSIVEIAGFRDQTFHVILPQDAQAGERRYRIVVDEIPDEAPTMQTGARARLRLTVPLFVGHAQAEPASIEAQITPHGIELANSGGRTVKFTRIALVDAAGRKFPLDLSEGEYLHGGAARTFALPASVTCRPGYRINGEAEGNPFDVALPEACA